MTCPTCGKGRGAQASADMVRHLTCWACGKPFTQTGPGRRRKLCGNPACERKRIRYCRAGYAALDRMRDA